MAWEAAVRLMMYADEAGFVLPSVVTSDWQARAPQTRCGGGARRRIHRPLISIGDVQFVDFDEEE